MTEPDKHHPRREKMMMKELAHENGLDALNASIAQLRAEIAAVAPDLKKLAEWRIDNASADWEHPQEGPDHGENGNGGWTAFQHRLGEAGTRGEKLAEGLAHEIERHPLIGGMAVSGLGFLIARLLFKRRNTV